MKKNNAPITSPEELNDRLQSTSFVTWLILVSVSLILIGFFTWATFFKIPIKVTGSASISGGIVTLNVNENDLNKLEVGQTVTIKDKKGEILSFNGDQPVVSTFALDDGDNYTYNIVVSEKRVISFVFGG